MGEGCVIMSDYDFFCFKEPHSQVGLPALEATSGKFPSNGSLLSQVRIGPMQRQRKITFEFRAL